MLYSQPGIDDLNADNFMEKLDNGAIVCKLARHIEKHCVIDETPPPTPAKTGGGGGVSKLAATISTARPIAALN